MSSVLKFVDDLVEQTSPADDAPRIEMQEGGAIKGAPRLPVTAELQELAQKLYGKNFSELTIDQRVKLRAGKIKTDPVTFQEYLDDYKKMAADPDYKPAPGERVPTPQYGSSVKKQMQKFEDKAMGGRIMGYQSGGKVCKLAVKGKGRAYGKNS